MAGESDSPNTIFEDESSRLKDALKLCRSVVADYRAMLKESSDEPLERPANDETGEAPPRVAGRCDSRVHRQGTSPAMVTCRLPATALSAHLVAVLAHVKRDGDWTLPRLFRAFALWGNAEVDLTRA